MIVPIQPGLLNSNTPEPINGLSVGHTYQAVNPYGLPGPFVVMYIQAAETVASRGLCLRQEFSALASEGALTPSATSTLLNRITDATHGLASGFISNDVEDGHNAGYFAYANDATAAAPEIVPVYFCTADDFFLGADLADVITTSDKYTIFKPGRMLISEDDEVLKPWGVSCAALTDEYYGFMVVKGWYSVNANGTGGNVDVTVGGGLVPGASGQCEGVTVGTDDVAVFAQAGAAVGSASKWIPAYINTGVSE